MDRDIEQAADLAATDDDDDPDELLDDPARLNELAVNISLLDPGSFR